MTKPIYVDFDDVLCESARTLATIAGSRYGKNVEFEEIYSFDLHDSFGLNSLEQEDLFTLFHDEDMLFSIPPIPQAIEGMQTWAAEGCRIEIVTGRPPVTQDVSCAWLAEYDVPYDDILFVDKYQRGHGDVAGVRQCGREDLQQAEYALAVDDSPDMIQFLASATSWPLALFDRPWNRALQVDALRDEVGRFLDWNKLLQKHPAPGVR